MTLDVIIKYDTPDERIIALLMRDSLKYVYKNYKITIAKNIKEKRH
jgi:hypothetical protein